MKINDLHVRTPYVVTQSKYQFSAGDKIYLLDNNILVVQGDGELHKVELVGGSNGLAVTGTDGGFLTLDERMGSDEFGEITEDFDGMKEDIDMRIFLDQYDETEFEPADSMVLLATDLVTKLVNKD